MGLIHNILTVVIHLLFVAMDILMTMILIKVVYQRWQPEWLRQINNTIEPLVVPLLDFVDRAVRRTAGKSLSGKCLVFVIIVSMWVTRFVVDGLFNGG